MLRLRAITCPACKSRDTTTVARLVWAVGEPFGVLADGRVVVEWTGHRSVTGDVVGVVNTPAATPDFCYCGCQACGWRWFPGPAVALADVEVDPTPADTPETDSLRKFLQQAYFTVRRP